jgi:hypothetical protein
MERAGLDLVIRQVDHNPTARCIAIFLDKRRTGSPGDRDHERSVEIEDDLQEYEYDVNDVISDLSITTVLQVDECLSCCIRGAMKFGGQGDGVYIIQA